MKTRPVEGKRGTRLTYYGVAIEPVDYTTVKRLANIFMGELPDLLTTPSLTTRQRARAQRVMDTHSALAVQFAVDTWHEWRRRRPR